jgi:uncharacterized membrane protein
LSPAAAGVLLLSLGVAAYALVMYSLVPLGKFLHPDLRAAFEANHAVVYVHVFASSVALILGPFQFMDGLRARRRELHRWMGRLYLGVGVLAGGLAGLHMSITAYGGLVSQLGFGALALGWLYTGLRAYLAIRAKDVATHRRWMVRNFALAFGAVTLRLWLPGSVAAGIPFEIAYPAVAWLCWVPNLVVAERILKGRG